MKNVSMWYHKKPIPQLNIFCLIQSINNYVQINTYWRYIVRIMASYILLLTSKFFFLTSQGVMGAGMNCRALRIVICYQIQIHSQKTINKATFLTAVKKHRNSASIVFLHLAVTRTSQSECTMVSCLQMNDTRNFSPTLCYNSYHVWQIVGSIPGQVKPKTLKLLFAPSLESMHH